MKDQIYVFMASDNNYAAITDISIISMLENTKSNIQIFLINNGITTENINRIKNSVSKYKNAKIEFLNLDIEKMFSGFKTWRHVSITAFARLLIPWLKKDIKKAIYVDGDVVFMNDIKKLYSQDLGKYSIGACKAIEISEKQKQEFASLIDLDKNHVYFNSGVLLIDCEKLRGDKNLPDGFFKIEEKYPNHLCADQDILNKYFENNYKKLEQIFNVTSCNPKSYENQHEYSNCISNMVIRHFIGHEKAYNSTDPYRDNPESYMAFWKYAQKSEFLYEFTIKMINKYAYPTKPINAWIKLFGILPLFKYKRYKLYLFGFLPLFEIKKRK